MTTLNTAQGEIKLTTSYYGGDVDFSIGGYEIGLAIPDADSVEELARGCELGFGYRTKVNMSELPGWMELVQFVQGVAELFNDCEKDSADAARLRHEKEQAAKAKAKEERNATLVERKERLQVEFLGERGRARMYGLKTSVPVEVKVRKKSYDSEEYVPYIESVNYADQTRTTDYRKCRRFEIKAGGRYMLVWDDGPDDLRPWDRENYSGDRNVPEYDGRLQRFEGTGA